MEDATQRIAENLAAIRDTFALAAAHSGRTADDVRLVAVTKYVSASLARCVVESGCRDLGESRPQALWEKSGQLSELSVRWHLIGHLQRNKIQPTLPHVYLLHSIDSLRLWQAVNQWASQHDEHVSALIEVNISGDANKHGFAPADVASAIKTAKGSGRVVVHGLMAMASTAGGLRRTRENFSALRELRDQLSAQFPDGPRLAELSMGMSGDFAVAIEEGATIVRVGSALFTGVDV